MWILLPAWGCLPTDYHRLFPASHEVTGPMWTGDPLLTQPLEAIRNQIAVPSEQVNLFGHSLGGLLAIEWMLRFPDEVNRVVLVDPTEPILPDHRHHPTPRADAIMRQAKRRKAYVELISPVAGIALPLARSLATAAGYVAGKDSWRAYAGVPNTRSWLTDLALSRPKQHAVGELINAGSTSGIETTMLISNSNWDSAFVGQQLKLAKTLQADRVEVVPSHHMFPLTKPHLVQPFL
ncbi:alpha/beta hydrolase [Corynebacterium cystitidis]|nr:alpha/beta fold hydrolase [Corynebacterium cystitidis]